MKLKRTIRKTFTNVIEHDVPKSAAALTYNLLFALFSLLIFISNLLGLLDLNVASITEALLPIMPGVVLAMVAWLVVSIGFSAYVENVADYSVIYGTLGAVIVLLIWLYLTSFILILGAEFNVALLHTNENSLL